jgi:hypothetical protein
MSANRTTHIPPPSLGQLLLEGRVFWELQAYWLALPWLQLTPRGDGHPVLVLPGLGVDDVSTLFLRQFLYLRGYNPQGWTLGRNVGPVAMFERRARRRLAALHAETGRKVSLIGWSLGGVYARELGRTAPDHVRQVITLGSPLHLDPKANNLWWLYELISGARLGLGDIDPAVFEQRRNRLTVPLTSIYSRSDGIVAWQTSVEPDGPLSENIEVVSSHGGLGLHPQVLCIVADRLAQPEGAWRPFHRRPTA